MSFTLLPRKREKALHDSGNAISFLDDSQGKIAKSRLICTILDQLSIVDDACERVVNLVRDTAGECADGLKFLALPQLAL